MDEKRRRAERNENILRTLERVDYQAQLLASKTERLRALKVNIKFTNYHLETTAQETIFLSNLFQNIGKKNRFYCPVVAGRIDSIVRNFVGVFRQSC